MTKPTLSQEERLRRKIERIENQKEKDDGLNFGGNRENALIRDKWQCQVCGLNQLQSIVLYGRGLIVHHIDGNGIGLNRLERNNDLENLQTLCASCHSKIHWSKKKC
jgi:predicted HNH restriction endonuclease